MFSHDTVVVAMPDQVSSELADEVVILNMQDGTYYGLNEVGARIWSMIQQPCSLLDVRTALLQEYDVAPEQLDQDIQALVDDLSKHSLITIQQ